MGKTSRSFHAMCFSFAAIILLLSVACASSGTSIPQGQATQIEPSGNTTSEATAAATPTVAENQLPSEPTPTEASSKAAQGPCDFLTKEEISGVIGQEIVNVEPRDTPRPNCHYETGPDANGNTGIVVVYVFTDFSAPGAFEIGKTEQDPNTQAVTGVGDQAYWSPSIYTLNVLYKEIYFTVQFLGTKDESVESASALAQKVIERLK